jgi:hypothetical protein
MGAMYSSFGRVLLAEWSGPVSVAMTVSLHSQLRQISSDQNGKVILILCVNTAAAQSLMTRSSTFLDIIPALWVYCTEIVFACDGENGTIDQLRRSLCGSASTPVSSLAKPMSFFELLDEAFAHVQGVSPHDVLELRRQRLRSGVRGQRDLGAVRKC